MLLKSYVGNVGYVGYRKKSHAKHTARAMTGLYCLIANVYRDPFSSVKIIANIANKMPKAAPRLGYRVGQNARKNSQHHANIDDKSTAKKSVKESLAFFYCVAIMVFSNTIYCKSVPKI